MNVALSTYHSGDCACFLTPSGQLVHVEDTKVPDGYEVLGYDGARRLLGYPERITDNPVYDSDILRAVGMSLLVKGGDHRWIASDSVMTYFWHTAADCHNLYRKHLPVPELSHRVGTGDIMANNESIAHIDPEVSGFAGLIHDDGEYFRETGRYDMTPSRIVLERWRGHSWSVPFLVHFSCKMTDPAHLSGTERIFGQVRTAIEENMAAESGLDCSFSLYGLCANGRVADKSSIYALDLWGFKNGLIRLPNQQKAESYLVKLHMKGDMLRLLPIDQKHKDDFAEIERQIDAEVCKLFPEINSRELIRHQFAWAKELIDNGALRTPNDPDGRRWTAWLADRMRYLLN